MKKFLHGWSLILTLALLTGLGSCSKDDAETPATVNVGQSMITFKAFDKEAKTITVDASQDWTFEVTGDNQVCEVTREEGSNVLTITPKINYDNVAYTANIVISAGEGSAKASQTITVTQEANADTYMIFQNSTIQNTDNPIITVENDPDGGESIYKILISTNNKLSVVYSENQGNPTTQSLEAGTRAAIKNCNWITYEVSEEETEEGTMTILTLSCTYNKDTKKSRTAFLEIVCGEGTKNTVLKKRLGITQMADTPTIIINAPEEGLVATYDQSKPLTFSVAGNVEFVYSWVQYQTWVKLTETTEKGDKSNVRNFSLEFSEWTGLSDREATLSFYAAEGTEVAAADVKVIQTAAPQASITLNTTSVVFNNGEENNTKYVEAECSFSTMDITTKDLATEAEADWLTLDYDASVKAISVKVKGTTEKTRSAEVKLYCGGNGNEASAALTVTQLGTEATLLLEPETVALNSKGTAQVVSVLTNQADWSVVDATATTDFTISVDKEKKTITVSGTPLDAGTREHVYTVKAGDLEKKLTVSQRTAYKVGDPYMVNGKPVGIVYQVDEAGMHGKAFALTTYNGWDKFFCYTGQSGFTMNESNAPLSRTDGLANQEQIKSIPNWEESFLMTKWTVDLGQAQGVNWYVPSIEELKVMIEYMSNAKFQTNPDTGIEALPPFEEVNPEWDIIRNLYKQYTTSENGYETEQYVVFYWGDARKETITDPNDWTIVYEVGDEVATYWASSTVANINTTGNPLYRMHLAKFDYGNESCSIRNDVDACTPYNDDPYYGGTSIHPICQF